jgi:predicted XRE-type DNA-binding protein
MKTTASRSISMICVKSRTSEMATREELLDGFGNWYEVEPNTGCWLWVRSSVYAGYGTVQFGGKQHLAHRVMKQVSMGEPIPDGMVVMHKCDTPCCVNPDHLMVSTQKENQRDMAKKGRSMRGRECPTAKITAEQASWIKTTDLPQKQMAEMLGISKQSVCDIKHGRTWKEA